MAAAVGGDAESLATLVEAARTAETAGKWDEALRAYEAAFARVHQEGTPGDAAALLRWIGTVHRDREELELAIEYYEASLAVAEANGLASHRAAGLNCLGIVEQLRGRLHQAEPLYARAHEIAESVGDERLSAMTSQNLATLATIRGEAESALRHYGWARDSFRRLDDLRSTAWVLNNMGMAHVDRGGWDDATACFDEAYALASRVGDAMTLGNVELNRTELYLRSGAFDRAREHCDQAFEIFTRLDSGAGLAEADKLYGMLYRDTVKPGLAETHFTRAVEAARTLPDPLLEAETLQEWARLHWEVGRSREALQTLNRAHAVFRDLGARRDLLDLDQRLTQMEELYLRAVQSWGESIESKDHYTAGHCQRVADYACALAEAAGLSGRDLTWFRMGAFLHDVGKVEIPETVLNKPGTLDGSEWGLMRLHTIFGERIAGELGFPWDIGPMIRSHHEHWDGTGYPDGLRGDEIPLYARILTVADVYDALTSHRSYRPALSREEALRVMERDAGTLLDPTLFDIFRGLALGSSGGRPAPEVAAG